MADGEQLRFLTVVTLMTLLLADAHGEIRMWTNKEGRTVNGDLVGLDEKVAILRIGEKDVPMALESLSEGDHEYIERWKKGHWKMQVRSVQSFKNIKSNKRTIARNTSGFVYLAVQLSIVPAEKPGQEKVTHVDFQLTIEKGEEEHKIIPRDFAQKRDVPLEEGLSGQFFVPAAEVSASGEIRESGGTINFEGFAPLTPGKEYRGWIYFSVPPEFEAAAIGFRKQASIPLRRNWL